MLHRKQSQNSRYSVIEATFSNSEKIVLFFKFSFKIVLVKFRQNRSCSFVSVGPTDRQTDRQTDTHTDRHSISRPQRLQYIQSMRMTECKNSYPYCYLTFKDLSFDTQHEYVWTTFNLDFLGVKGN